MFDFSTEALRNCSNYILIAGLIIAALGTGGVNLFRGRLEKERETQQSKRDILQANKDQEVQDNLAKLLAQSQVLETKLAPFEELARKRYPTAQNEEGLVRLRQELAGIEARTVELEAAARPRGITEEQRLIFAKYMTAQPRASVWITCVSGDAESCGYARQIGDLFKKLGYPTDVTEVITFSSTPGPLQGIRMVANEEQFPPCAPALQGAFREMGIEVPAFPSNDAKLAGKIKIDVGVKKHP